MVSVESLLRGLVALCAKNVIKDSWHRSFLSSVNSHVVGGSSMSTNQGATVLKVAGKYAGTLANALGVPQSEVLDCIKNPKYDKSPYQSISIPREVRYIGMDKLAFRFKVDNTVVAEIKQLRSAHDPVNSAPKWDNKYRLWIVTVTPQNIDKVFSIIQRHRFHFDEPVLEYMTLCSNSKKASSTFAAVEGTDIAVANICANPLLSYVVKNVLKGEPV